MMNNEITKEWIAQQRALCDAATPGEWEKNKKSVIVKGTIKKSAHGERVLPTGYNGAICNCTGAGYGDVKQSPQNIQAENNSAFIAAARTALPAALDALEAAYAEIASLQAERGAAQVIAMCKIQQPNVDIGCYHCSHCGCKVSGGFRDGMFGDTEWWNDPYCSGCGRKFEEGGPADEA